MQTLIFDCENDYVCIKCKIVIWHDITYKQVRFLGNDNWINELELTCEEHIIKNIIE